MWLETRKRYQVWYIIFPSELHPATYYNNRHSSSHYQYQYINSWKTLPFIPYNSRWQHTTRMSIHKTRLHVGLIEFFGIHKRKRRYISYDTLSGLFMVPERYIVYRWTIPAATLWHKTNKPARNIALWSTATSSLRNQLRSLPWPLYFDTVGAAVFARCVLAVDTQKQTRKKGTCVYYCCTSAMKRKRTTKNGRWYIIRHRLTCSRLKFAGAFRLARPQRP